MAQKTSRQIIIHQMYEHKNKNQAPKIIQDMELEEAKKKKKGTNLHYELPSTGRSHCLVVQTQGMCKTQNVYGELQQEMHCTMGPSLLVLQWHQ